MARAYGSRAQMALAFETTYGVPPTSGFHKMPFVSSTLGSEQPLVDSDLVGFGRDPLAPGRGPVTVDGTLVVPVDAVGIGHWLKALFGAPLTSGTAPATHSFHSGADTLPSLSIEIGMPEVPRHALYSGVMADTLKIEMARTGNLTAQIGLVAQGEAVGAVSRAGSPAEFPLHRFVHFQGAIRRDGQPLAELVSAEIAYSNNLERIETIRPDGKIDGADPTVASLGGKIVTRFSDLTLMEQALNGSACSLEFSWVLGPDISLTLTAHAVYLPRPRLEISGPKGVQCTFDWQAARGQDPARLCTLTLLNPEPSYA